VKNVCNILVGKPQRQKPCARPKSNFTPNLIANVRHALLYECVINAMQENMTFSLDDALTIVIHSFICLFIHLWLYSSCKDLGRRTREVS
jgi:hypothetical protein